MDKMKEACELLVGTYEAVKSMGMDTWAGLDEAYEKAKEAIDSEE